MITTPILPNMIPMRDIKQISEGDRLFYELGYKIDWTMPYDNNNWVRKGIFKEIEDVKKFVDGDKQLSDIEYLEHHNFMLIKNNMNRDNTENVDNTDKKLNISEVMKRIDELMEEHRQISLKMKNCNDSFEYDNLDRRLRNLRMLFIELGILKYVS